MLSKKKNIEINDTFDLVQSPVLTGILGKMSWSFAGKNDIASLSFCLFSRGEQTENSDIDFLVTFSKGKSLIEHLKIENEFEDILGKKVDIVTEKSLSQYISPLIKMIQGESIVAMIQSFQTYTDAINQIEEATQKECL
ncbi:MAG: nucleotidyltransferase domain-containing protein [Methanolobus sp.]